MRSSLSAGALIEAIHEVLIPVQSHRHRPVAKPLLDRFRMFPGPRSATQHACGEPPAERIHRTHFQPGKLPEPQTGVRSVDLIPAQAEESEHRSSSWRHTLSLGE